MKTIKIELSFDDYKRLKKMADKKNMSVQELIIEILTEHVKELERPIRKADDNGHQ